MEKQELYQFHKVGNHDVFCKKNKIIYVNPKFKKVLDNTNEYLVKVKDKILEKINHF